ncbi:hypothetical protein ADU78_07405 [Clostridium botulinum]|uniref:hypothetical protein n=1 Tax=Clostridium botulinum TaxID=1491 RepID=UPI0004D7B147|nr:hypothetical protein [Clostridium botulinum]KEI04294.1 hypothetical protein Z953_03000 [Clostridium botulinum D str. 16868]KOA75678.1 hypothetical protein ADU78_07405 [Clostridium botulinum]
MTLEEQLFWMELEHRKKKAESFDTSKVNLQATGEELRIILEDMFAYPIDNSWEHIKFCMDYNNWTLKEIIQAREKMNLLQGNPLQIVSCSKEILKRY